MYLYLMTNIEAANMKKSAGKSADGMSKDLPEKVHWKSDDVDGMQSSLLLRLHKWAPARGPNQPILSPHLPPDLVHMVKYGFF